MEVPRTALERRRDWTASMPFARLDGGFPLLLRVYRPDTRKHDRDSVAGLILRFLNNFRKIAKAKRFSDVRRYCLSLARRYANLSASRLTNDQLLAWIAANPRWKSPCTKHNAANAAFTAFRWGLDHEVIPTSKLKRRRLNLPEQKPRKPLKEVYYRRLLASAKKTGRKKSRTAFRCAMFFLQQTGSRTSEMRLAEWHEVDWDRGVIDLEEHKTDHTGQSRVITLTRGVLLLLALWHRSGRTEGPIFRNGRGKPYGKDCFCDLFRQHADRAGLPKNVSAYGCRHSFIMDSLEAGNTERETADLVGHSSTAYIGWYSRELKSKTDYLAKSLKKFRGKRKNG